MEAKDRRFAEIAARLQLLTQEQVATCAQYIRSKQGKSFGAAAVDLGFITTEQADLVGEYEIRLKERQRKAPVASEAERRGDARAPAVVGEIVEERVKRPDPRSASSPVRAVVPQGARTNLRGAEYGDVRGYNPSPAAPMPQAKEGLAGKQSQPGTAKAAQPRHTVTGRGMPATNPSELEVRRSVRPTMPSKPLGEEAARQKDSLDIDIPSLPPAPTGIDFGRARTPRERDVPSRPSEPPRGGGKRGTIAAPAPPPFRAPSGKHPPAAKGSSAERKPERDWAAPARREDGQVLVPQRKPSGARRPHNVPTARVTETEIEAQNVSARDLPATLPPPPAAPNVPVPGGDAAWFDLRDPSRPVRGHGADGDSRMDSGNTQAGLPAAMPRGTSQGAMPAMPAMPHASGTGMGAARVAALGGPATAEAHIRAGGRAATVAPPTSYLGRALALAVRQGASDLHAHSGAPILIRVDGVLRPLSGNEALTPSAADKVIYEVMGDPQKATLEAKGEVDFACEVPGVVRMRVNVYRQQRGLDAVFRLVPREPPTFEQLGLPPRLARLTDYRTGMVLCTGPAGSGKSTTLSLLVSALTQTRSDHILSIEDPVEFVYPASKALVNQRQLREHTSSFARALRAALREDPDVIVISELRDRDTISLAISAAETGHLVLGTLTTGNASQTISRIVSSFSSDEQEQMRVMLAESLRAVVSQRLVPKSKGGGRVPAIELLMVNTAVSNLIREDKTHQLPSVMQTGKAAGMVTLDDSLDELLRAGTITVESARRFAVRKERFGG